MQLTPKEGYALMNLLVAEATGVNSSISVVDTSTFVSAGETVLATGKENVLNALSMVIGRTLVRSESYEGRFNIINESDESLYEQRVREILFYDDKALPAGNWNTKEASPSTAGYTNLSEGFDNGSNSGSSVPSMWEQHRKRALEINFCGMVVWDYGITLDDDAFKIAFTDVNEFTAFVSGILTEVDNDIESEKEAFRRMVFLNRLAEAINYEDTYGTAVNLTKAFNDKFGTNYTSEQLRTTYLKEFTKFFVAYIKNLSNALTYRSKKYHNPYTITEGTSPNTVEYNVLTHTKKAKQKLVLYNPLFIDAEAYVMPEIFNPKYLDINNYEAVDFWQNIEDPSAIKVTPTSISSGVQVAGDTVDCPFIVGALFDDRAVRCGTFMLSADTTPLEARKKYRNIWWHIAKKSYDNMAYPFITFYMLDTSSDNTGGDTTGGDTTGGDTTGGDTTPEVTPNEPEG